MNTSYSTPILVKKIMTVILVTDIFGKTPALVTLAKELNATFIIDPYNGVDMDFNNEADAYAYFSKEVGFDGYFDQLAKAVTSPIPADNASSYAPITFIGFSVGAAVIWRLSAIMNSDSVKNAFLFYGSQIRNFTEIEPKFDVNVIFPKKESHFDVLALQARIAQKTKVKLVKTNYLHGFMNRHSSNYDHTAYNEHIDMLRSFIS